MIFADAEPSNGQLTGGMALAFFIAYAIRDLFKSWSDRNDKRAAAEIERQERQDKAAFDSRLTTTETKLAAAETKLDECEGKHRECEEAREVDNARHELGARERAAAIAEVQRELEEVKASVGFAPKPRKPKSGGHPPQTLRITEESHGSDKS